MASEEAFLKKLRAAFVAEAQEQVELISSGLATLQNNPEADAQRVTIEDTFRVIHNMKGSARAVNLVHLEAVCQSLEDVFASLKKSERTSSPKLLDALHGVVDTIAGSLTTFDTAQNFEESSALLPLLDILKNLDVEAVKPKPQMIPSDDLPDFIFPTDAPKPAAAAPPAPVPDTSREVVRISSARLDELLMRAEDMLSLKIMARQHNQDLSNVDFRFNPYNRELTKVYTEVRAARQLIRHDDASTEHLYIGSVLTKVLDFLDWQQSQLSALSGQLSVLKATSENDYRLATNTVDTFLEDTKKLLMMPSATLLELMPKLVRDLSRELGKEVDLTINGSNIQLDKRVLAQLKDPLIHILRNSIDHGLEKPDARVQSGKPSRGRINISVTQKEGSTVEIVIADDGAGIDTDKIKEAAIKNGMVSHDDASTMTNEEAVSLIFQSSFSTRASVSEISGRGLGLAIARENISRLGGRLVVETVPQKGTTFRINLPVTIATFRGVLIKCSTEILVVPTSDMERVIKIASSDIQSVEGGKTINVDGRLLPLIRLDEVLELPVVGAGAKPKHHLVMVLHTSEATMAFVIDEVLEEQEVLVKKLSKPIVRARNLAGVTVLGSGKPAPILNVSDVIKSAQKLSRAESDRSIVPDVQTEPKSVLVVDDTITARILMKNILESAGYSVKTANDGQEALTLLHQKKFDLLLTDIEMPKMNGIELTAQVKKDPALKKMPVVLVTSMTDSEFRERGQQAGADAFFVKSSFDKSNLLDVVKKLI